MNPTCAIARLCALASLVAGCQTYDFQPVVPIAVAQTSKSTHIVVYGLKPDLMLVVDKSGSMNDAIDGSLTACRLGDGRACGSSTSPCPTGCPTRMSELRTAMGGFLAQYGRAARLGLTTFPDAAANACGVGKVALDVSQSSDVGSELQARADELNAAIQALVAGGGTPTGATLRTVAALPSLKNPSREDFVVLLTDGLPNCNENNVADPSACLCTSCGCVQSTCSKLLCLDGDDTIAVVRALRAEKIRTIVIGFGADTATGPAVEVLNAMAVEGGFPRACTADADCGAGDRCGAGGICDRKFYQASNAAELGKALENISKIIDPKRACTIPLDSVPTDDRMISVLVDAVDVQRGADTWNLISGAIVFADTGPLCTRIKSASELDPVDVEIRVLEAL